MFSKRKVLIKVMVGAFVCAAIGMVSVSDVSADTSAKTKQGVTLKTSELKVNKVIVSPKPVNRNNESTGNNSNREVSNNTSSQPLTRGVNSSSNQVINYAYNFLGRPYVYGANGPNSFDCSGFTSYVYKHFGVGLPRTSQSQFGAGSAVSRNNLSVGDLVFFNTYASLGHVGIYIGNGDFIHAASSGSVRVSSLNEGYYSSRFAGGRRVF
ncbi:C40 family peptidase [Clostridium paraputrificum]|uniref:C40 family peptidase n=1 Tax=Clostridium TaxID=1485 RepID=UPI003D33ADED